MADLLGSISLHIKQPLTLDECSSEVAVCILLVPEVANTSTSHSYHTLRSSVCRHIDTSISALSGTNMGVCQFESVVWLFRDTSHRVRTLRGKKIGNQLIISRLFASMVTGFVLSSIGSVPAAGEYNTVSK